MLVLLALLSAFQSTTAHKSDIDIYSLTVDSKVSSRFAHTVVSTRVVNRADTAKEAVFHMELPKKAFITNFSMIIDGVTYPGNITEKVAAQEQYSAAQSRGESAGLVKATVGRKMEQFQVSVSVAPASKVIFQLTYEELLKRQLGVYELRFKIQPQEPVKHLQMDIHIFEPQGISHLETESSFLTSELEEALTTTQNQTKAHIRFKPSLSHQDKVLDGNFIVRYDVNRTNSAGSILIENGFFVHHFAPKGLPSMPKNVIFVIDKSGSMGGRKIEQTREALIKILGDLRPHDLFNLIVFSGEVNQWKPSLVPASAENVHEAKSYAATLMANGGTNINHAMLMAVDLLHKSTVQEVMPSGSVSLIILLTDGDPTTGETNPAKIQKNVREAVDGRYSIFCLGFGYDVSYAFLEKLALDNGGLARRIYEDSDSALQLQDFYQEVANPLMTSVSFEYPSNAVEQVTQDNFRLLFKGSEMVVAGKLQDQSPDVFLAKVSGRVHKQNFTFLTEANVAEQELFRSPKYIFHNFMERLWAYLTIQQLLEQIVSASDDERADLEKEALRLSLNYSFVTSLTSMVITKPEGQQQPHVANKPKEDSSDINRKRYYPSGQEKLPVVSTPAPIKTPHFILPLPGQSMDPLCVDIKHFEGTIRLFSDPEQGIEVTGLFEKSKFSRIEVTFKEPDVQVRAFAEHVVVTRNRGNSAYKWKDTLFSVTPGLKITMDKTGLLLLSAPDKVTIGLLYWEGTDAGLRILLRDTERFSSFVDGTLGQFYQGVLFTSPVTENKKKITVHGKNYHINREFQLDYRQGLPGTGITCWSIVL
ncbi:PREDICTED: inter-alpha-trypsin inhibitor heavy chain H4 [Elephantulus edwardii]|uniref:inter-alpha-trypsin inhibitor heavy chain H4 n=1 Tax=Elephantulus edwardii TaxID=28737 RepID=UPI0003F0C1CE|nr:PREDICTED: inter-alpha-trypsin inhibitor heavy chain H4 [Elephantulus edwardii]